MRLTKENSNDAICAALMGKLGKGLRFYCPKTQNIFEASPCDTCGVMSAHGGEIHIDHINDALHRTFSSFYKVMDFNECLGYDEDGNEVCEECN